MIHLIFFKKWEFVVVAFVFLREHIGKGLGVMEGWDFYSVSRNKITPGEAQDVSSISAVFLRYSASSSSNLFTAPPPHRSGAYIFKYL